MPDATTRAATLDLLLELAVLVEQDMTTGLARDGLTRSRAHLLFEVVHRGPSTQRVLAEAMQISPRTVTGLVDGLVATGFVTREPHPGDRRAALVTLTAHGRGVADRLVAGRTDFAEELLGGLPAERLAGLRAGLTDVVARMRELVDGPDGTDT